MGVTINADNLANVGYFYGKVIKGNYRGPFSLAFSTASIGFKDIGSIIDNLKQEVQMKSAEQSPS